jgi:hypothetical protein
MLFVNIILSRFQCMTKKVDAAQADGIYIRDGTGYLRKTGEFLWAAQ